MQTKTLIQAQANVITITSLSKGNVVKIIDTTYSQPEIKYAVVLDLMNDGTNSFVELIEYKKSYSKLDAEIKIYEGDTELALFPCEPDEVKEFFGKTIDSLKKDIDNKKEELFKLEESCKKAEEFVSGELQQKLTKASYAEITQDEFNATTAPQITE